MKRRIANELLATAALLAAACGGSGPEASAPMTVEQAAANESASPRVGGGGGHGKLTPELRAFHDLLAPRWHAPKGQPRRADTCSAVAQFRTRAAAVVAAPPAGRRGSGVVDSAAAELDRSVTGLATACRGTDPAAFDTAFETVHTRYHHAMELVAGEHDRRGGHREEPEGHGHHGAPRGFPGTLRNQITR